MWCYRLFLNREPESEATIDWQIAVNADLRELRGRLIDSSEFFAIIRNQEYGIPSFLLPPIVNGEMRIKEPTLESPSSQMATYSQMQERHYTEFLTTIGVSTFEIHRKYWEWAYIWRALEVTGMTQAGKRGLVFAVGAEPIPSMLAKRGVKVHASDSPQEIGEMWRVSQQFSDSLKQLWREDICSWEDMEQHVSFREVDMLNIPTDLRDFDFCWSSCSLEHIGGIEPGLQFIENTLETLKPGGIAVHTTEFNLSSNDKTIDGFPTCLFRRQDLEKLTDRLRQQGHKVWDWNFWPGAGQHDFHIDFPPFAPPHLKINLYQYVSTSIGLVVEKKA
ncbi:class I SAM-dependent methyltransferase [Asticcacaulis sp. SL142]|uniref:class I SAM-dependent methyltransferase n=1 Tax=Asticcacaulis sp. SL142 TaxID=2995155 RepID=UPI00226D297A|nr:class I SAM-dependent methyltransferase [Asticcacaulis sp. SL142]WAC49435.1 class I SAM-dependent methyltransferase [Asticcacaulis sp. SL142]